MKKRCQSCRSGISTRISRRNAGAAAGEAGAYGAAGALLVAAHLAAGDDVPPLGEPAEAARALRRGVLQVGDEEDDVVAHRLRGAGDHRLRLPEVAEVP